MKALFTMISKTLVIGAFAALTLTTLPALTPSFHAAKAQTSTIPCGARASVLDQLAQRYHEAPANMGLAHSGGVVEILTSETGSWTIVLTHPNGISCLLSAGEHWEPVKQKKKKAGYTPS